MLEIPFPPGWFPPDAPPATLCYLVKQEEGWLLVDAGLNHDTCFDALCQQLAALSVSLEDIRWLLITHFHPDHFGMAGRIRAASNAKLLMHQEDWKVFQFVTTSAEEWSSDEFVEWARSMGMPDSELDGFREVVTFGRMLFPEKPEPDILLQGEEEQVGDTGRLRAILTPGHSPGHVCVYDEGNKLLFSGDHVLLKITTNITPSYLGEDHQLSQYLASLQKVSKLDVGLVLPAHEKPFSHLSQRVDELLEHHENRLEHVLSAVRQHHLNLWEIASQVEWTVGPWDKLDAMNKLMAIQETQAHLNLLQERGRVTQAEENGQTLYKLLGA